MFPGHSLPKRPTGTIKDDCVIGSGVSLVMEVVNP